MDIRILHIDDEQDVLEKLNKIVTGTQIGDDTLRVVDSCGFEEGMAKLKDKQYELVILDLCVGNASKPKDKVGEQIFEQIKALSFIPVIFFTGLPDYVARLQSDIVRVVGKADGYGVLLEQIKVVLSTGFIKIKRDVEDITREGVRSYFWNFVHQNQGLIQRIKDDEVSLKYLLLRRLGKSLSSETLKANIEDPQMKKELAHPMEFYIFPPVDGEYETGDIIKAKKTAEYYVILTPACDLIARESKARKAEKVLLVYAQNFKSSSEYQKYVTTKALLEKTKKEREELPEKRKNEVDSRIELLTSQVKNLSLNLKSLMKPHNDRYFFLPETPFLPALLIDFQHKITVPYIYLDNDYDVIATLDDPFSQSLQTSFTRYYNRIGFPDLDVEYAFTKME